MLVIFPVIFFVTLWLLTEKQAKIHDFFEEFFFGQYVSKLHSVENPHLKGLKR